MVSVINGTGVQDLGSYRDDSVEKALGLALALD